MRHSVLVMAEMISASGRSRSPGQDARPAARKWIASIRPIHGRGGEGRPGQSWRVDEAKAFPVAANELSTGQTVEPVRDGLQGDGLLLLHVQNEVQGFEQLRDAVGLFRRFQQRQERQEARHGAFRA